jgi:transcriptional antiterminator NusG
MAESAKWYVLHTYSGYENAVATTIEKAVENRRMQDLIYEVSIPMETVTEVTDSGVTKTVERKVFPGYVLIKMVMTDESWHLVRNTRGVTGFVGSANKAIPLSEEEIAALGMDKQEITVAFKVGSNVKVTDGPLEGFSGVVDDVDIDKSRLRVIVSMFGRETPVDLEFDQVEIVEE